jgi:hypothetical protein
MRDGVLPVYNLLAYSLLYAGAAKRVSFDLAMMFRCLRASLFCVCDPVASMVLFRFESLLTLFLTFTSRRCRWKEVVAIEEGQRSTLSTNSRPSPWLKVNFEGICSYCESFDRLSVLNITSSTASRIPADLFERVVVVPYFFLDFSSFLFHISLSCFPRASSISTTLSDTARTRCLAV